MTGRPIPYVALQVLGLACLMVAVWMIQDGWYALGLFGLAVLAAVEMAHRD